MSGIRFLDVRAVDNENQYLTLKKGMKHRRNTVILRIGNLDETGKSVGIEVLEAGLISLLKELGIGRGEFYLDRVFDDTYLLSAVLSAPVEVLEFSIRTSRCLKIAGIKTIGQLVDWTAEELLRISSFGRKSLAEIREELEMLGLRLKEGQE